MTNKELKRLSRRELLEMMIDQEKEIERLQKKVEKLEAEAADRTLKIEKAGSMAEAALALNGIFEAADAAVKQFTDSVKKSAEQNDPGQPDVSDEEKKAAAILSEAEERAEALIKEAEQKKADILKEAEEGAEERWEGLYQRLEEFYASHPGLKDALMAEKDKNTQEAAKS